MEGPRQHTTIHPSDVHTRTEHAEFVERTRRREGRVRRRLRPSPVGLSIGFSSLRRWRYASGSRRPGSE
mgnify:CR=1 FL=1